MEHLPKLIEDLALILIVGAIVTILFKAIKQPLVLGYIIAGFCVGPYLSLIPTVADTENVKTLAEIGVIFLLFGLGLEFNLKKIVHIGGPSSITAFVEIIFITLTGFALGKIMGWSTMDSIFLGGMLASSSTTIIIKAFDDLGLKAKQYVKIVFGVLVIEDIIVILILVLLPTIALAQNIEGKDFLLTILKLAFFLILVVIAGVFVLPPVMKRAKSIINEETLLVLSTGLCLGMVVLAIYVGFTAELGAFIMGFIFAESSSSEKIEKVIKPVKDLFAAVFFVSIGMMINPDLILKHLGEVMAVTLLTIIGKLISTTGGAILSGLPLKQSVHIGMSMAQIGEFAFIVASLGLSLGVISEFLFPVAVGASAITTFTTPYMIKYSDKFNARIERILPPKWLSTIQNYSLGTQTIQKERNWKSVLKKYVSIIIVNGIILLSLILLSEEFLLPFLRKSINNYYLSSFISLIITLLIILPFLWGMMVKRPSNLSYKELWINKMYNKGPLVVIETLRILLGITIIGFLVSSVFSAIIAIMLLVPIIIIVLIIFSRQLNKFYHRIENKILSKLSTGKNDDE